MTFLLFLARLFLGGIFVVSAVPKLFAPQRSVRDIKNYRLLPGPLAIAYGWALPFVEIGVALSLLSGYGVREAAFAALVLLTSFMTAFGVAMARKQNLECNCFGLLYRERVSWATQARDAVLWAVAATVAVGGPGSPPLGEMLLRGTFLERAASVFTLFVFGFVMSVGWIAARGWPRWVIHARMAARGFRSGERAPT